MIENLEKAIGLAGGQTQLAKMIGVSQPRMWNWLNRDKTVPGEYVRPICEAVNNQVLPSELRPDIFGDLEKVS